jgi:Dinucleotide-utilizing enzymes involved in molybdopterin and thiamine biosynthesis family 1
MTVDRTALLYSEAKTAAFRQKKIVLVGLGGVGLYALENLARAGIKRFVLIDGDVFEPSNLNRQLYATIDTLGQKKAEAAKARIASIDPAIEAESVPEFLSKDNIDDIVPKDADFIIDAIDDIPAKAEIILFALRNGIPVISSMGTARRTDPSKMTVTTLGKTTACPLARKLRKLLREEPASKAVPVVMSKETPCEVEKGSPLPSSGMVPAAAGINLAAFVINTFCKEL